MSERLEFSDILGEYRKLWNNRQLKVEVNAERTLRDAIIRELKDENSHPRVRKLLFEKYYLASKRIITSSLIAEYKIKLLELHTECLEMIKQEGES